MDLPSERLVCIFLFATCLLISYICITAMEITLIYIERLCVVIRNRLSLLRRTNIYGLPRSGKVAARELCVENERRRTGSEVWKPQQQGKPQHLIGPLTYSRGQETTGSKSCDSAKNSDGRCTYEGGGTESDTQDYGKEQSEDIGEARGNKDDRNSPGYRHNEMQRENVSTPNQRNASSQNNGNHFIEDEDGDVIMEDANHLEILETTISKTENQNMQKVKQIGGSKLMWGHDVRQIYLFSCDSPLNVVGNGESCFLMKTNEKNRNGEACRITRTQTDRCNTNGVRSNDASSSSSTVRCKEMRKDCTPREQAPPSQKISARLVTENQAGDNHQEDSSFLESKMPISPSNELERLQAPQKRDVHPIKKEIATPVNLKEAGENMKRTAGAAYNNTSQDLFSNSKTFSNICNDASIKSCRQVGHLCLPETARSATPDADIFQPLPVSSDITTAQMPKLDTSTNISCPYVPVTTNISQEIQMPGVLTNIVNCHMVEPGGIEAKERKPKDAYVGQKDWKKLALLRNEYSQVSVSPRASATLSDSWRRPFVARTQEAGALRRKMPPLVRDPTEVVDLTDFFLAKSSSLPLEPVHYPEHSPNDSELKRRFCGNNGSRDGEKQGLTVDPGLAVMTKPKAAAVRKWVVPKRVRESESEILKALRTVGERKEENPNKQVQTLHLPVVPNPGHLVCDSFFHTGPENAKKRNMTAEPEPAAVRKPDAAARRLRAVSRRPRAEPASRKRDSEVIGEPMIFGELNDVSLTELPQTLDFGPIPDNIHRFLNQEKTFFNMGSMNAKKRGFTAEPDPVVFDEQEVASKRTKAVSTGPRTTVPRERGPEVKRDPPVGRALSDAPPQSLHCPFGSNPECNSSVFDKEKRFFTFGSGVPKKRAWTGESGTEMTRKIEVGTMEKPTASKRSRAAMATGSLIVGDAGMSDDAMGEHLLEQPQVLTRPAVHHPENLPRRCGIEEPSSDPTSEPMEESPTNLVQTLESPVVLNTESLLSCSQTELTFWEALRPAPWNQEPAAEPMETLSYIETPFTYITEVEKPEHAIEMMEWDPIEPPPIVGLPVGPYATQLNNPQDEDMETCPSYATHWTPAVFQSVISGVNVNVEEMCY